VRDLLGLRQWYASQVAGCGGSSQASGGSSYLASEQLAAVRAKLPWRLGPGRGAYGWTLRGAGGSTPGASSTVGSQQPRTPQRGTAGAHALVCPSDDETLGSGWDVV
jgi:hypothetical protein